MILLEEVCKNFVVYEREKGLKGAFKGAFARKKKEINAVQNVSFTIKEGEMVGYIGPNGAGKSTTVKMMSGILNPDKGRIEINGIIPYKQRVKHVSNIGVVFGQRSQLWWDIPVIDSFYLLKVIYNVGDFDFAKRIEKLSEVLNMNEFIKTPVRQLSLGQRIRAELAAALIHNPKLLFLDEPTIGLDAVSKLELRKFLKEINKENGTTILLTTHDMDDIESLCKRVMVIGRGVILYDGELSSLKKTYSPYKCMEIKLEDTAKNILGMYKSLRPLKALKKMKIL